MELDNSNLIQILSFESRFIDKLLQDVSNSEQYSSTYPMFYKMQQTKGLETRIFTPVSLALENNQIVALNRMIEYVVKYQNTYAFSFLFEEDMHLLLEKGIKVTSLFESKIFIYTFELEDWPIIHDDYSSCIRPYNGSKFDLEGKYNQVFPKYADNSKD